MVDTLPGEIPEPLGTVAFAMATRGVSATRVVTPAGIVGPAEVVVESGRIQSIDAVASAPDRILMPGFVDTGLRLRRQFRSQHVLFAVSEVLTRPWARGVPGGSKPAGSYPTTPPSG